MKRVFFAVALLGVVACEPDSVDVKPENPEVETFDTAMSSSYTYGYESDDLKFEHFYNEEYAYWGGFAQSNVKDSNAANGLFANQYAVYNDSAASGDSFMIYYYDSYNEPCDIVLNRALSLSDVKLNLTTYTYASITDEAINDFARAFIDGDYLKVVFTPLLDAETVVADKAVECYVVDYRDNKREATTDWKRYDLLFDAEYYGVRVTIETTDVGDYGANTPLYIAMDDLFYTVE